MDLDPADRHAREESGFADDASTVADEDERQVLPLPRKSLTEIEDDGAEEEDANRGGEVDDAADEEDEEDEDEEEEESDRPKKKKRRKRAGNQFLDIEADVDEDEDEEEDEGEEGFLAPMDDFITNKKEPRQRLALGALPADEDFGDYEEGDGDASHRRLDQAASRAKDKEAAALAAGYHDRYGRARYDTEGMEEWAPKALLMPGVNDPSIWGIKCKIGRERDLVLSLSRKAAALAASDNAAPLQIISAFQRDSIKGYIYVEARSEAHVRTAINGLIGVYSGSAGGVFLVDIEEMPDLLKTKQKKVEIVPGSWVRIKRGKYAGDLAQIVDLSENGEDVALKFIPRIDLTPKDEHLMTGSDGKKRKKGVATPLAFRPPQRFFNPEEIGKIYGSKEVSKRQGGILLFRNDTYKDGYCEKDIKLSGLTIEDVQPTLDELTRFVGESGAKGVDGEGGLDFSHIAEAARKAAKSILQPGDHVEIYEGDQRGIHGKVDSISNDVVLITPHEDLNLGDRKVEVQARSVRKHFKAGDHVKVMNGANADETGLVVEVKNDVVTFLSDLTMQEVTVFSKDVREAAEVGSGVNVIGQYELHDLVQLDMQTTGVIFKIERDTFRILDQSGTVRSLKPSQIGIKANSRNAVATDQDGYNIVAGDEMKEAGTTMREGRTGRVLHVYRSMFAFLYNRKIVENGGVFVTYARSLVSTAPKGASSKAKLGQGLNPDRFAAAPVVNAGANGRPDGRIHRRVSVTRGAYKGYAGVVKDVTGATARVELHTNSKVITISLEHLKEQKSDGTLIPLLERPQNSSYGGSSSYGGAGGFRPNANREDSSFSTSSNAASLGSSRTPFPNSGFAGGRTPAPGQYSGGRTPAPQYSGGRTPAPGIGDSSSSAWDASGRTPAYTPNDGAPSAWNASSRTPAHASSSSDAWNASSRTPHHPSASDAWNASSRTPHHQPSYGDDTPAASDPRGSTTTPAYGAKSSYTGRADRAGEPQSAPTPGTAGRGDWGNDWDSTPATAPTPAATGSRDYPSYQPKTPYDAPTPGGAPTPAPYPHSYSAPTPAPYGAAPTPAPYGGAPTPGPYGAPTPAGHYTAPTPHSQTPGAYGASASTPGNGSGQTPGTYAGAATTAAQPLEYQQRAQEQSRLPADWAVPGLRAHFVRSSFQNGRLDDQNAVVLSSQSGLCNVKLESTGEPVNAVPWSYLLPIPPTKPSDMVIVLGGPNRGIQAETLSRDGNEWMVRYLSPPVNGSNILEAAILGVLA